MREEHRNGGHGGLEAGMGETNLRQIFSREEQRTRMEEDREECVMWFWAFGLFSDSEVGFRPNREKILRATIVYEARGRRHPTAKTSHGSSNTWLQATRVIPI